MFWNFSIAKSLHGRITHCNQNKENHYNVLRISNNSTHEQIRDAFMQLSKKYHPDAAVGPHISEIDHTSQFVKISEAYQTLRRPSLKKQYDQTLWMHSMADRKIKTGTYGFIHDFHCFGRHKAQRKNEANYMDTLLKIKPVKKPIVNANKKRQTTLPKTVPKFLYQMINVLVTHNTYAGVCGAVFGVVNARCGLNHSMMHTKLSNAYLMKKRGQMLQNLWKNGRKYLQNVSNMRTICNCVDDQCNKEKQQLHRENNYEDPEKFAFCN